MRTTAKPVVDAIRKHVLDEFEERALYEMPELDPNSRGSIVQFHAKRLLNDQIMHMQYGDRSLYQTALDWVEGGSLLVYHYEVKEFLNGLGINPTGQEYSDEKSWRLYCHLVAREITKLIEKGTE